MGLQRVGQDWATELKWTVYSCQFLLISSAVSRLLTVSVLYLSHPYMKCFLDISNFLEETSSFCFVFFFFSFCYFPLILCIVHLRNPFISLAFLWNSAFSSVYLSPLPFTSLLSAVCKAVSDNYFAFLHTVILVSSFANMCVCVCLCVCVSHSLISIFFKFFIYFLIER